MRRGLALLAVLMLLVSCTTWEALAEDNVRMGRTEPLYSEAMAGYTLPVYGKDAVTLETDLTLEVGDSGKVDFSVPEDGQYEIWLTYLNTTQSTLPTELIVRVDDTLPFYELRRVKLNSIAVDRSASAPPLRTTEAPPLTPRLGPGVACRGGGVQTFRPQGRAGAGRRGWQASCTIHPG